MTATSGNTWTLGVERLTKSFATGAVLRGVDLRAAPGTLTVVHGALGSGRTTLLRCLAGTYRPTSGRILLGGVGPAVDLAGADARVVAWVRQHRLAVFDGGLAAPPRTTGVAAVARLVRVDSGLARAGFEFLGLPDLADLAIGWLRPEQARQVGLVAALVQPAGVVLLDEPLAALDTAAVRVRISQRRAEGDAVVVTAPEGQAWDADAAGVLTKGVIRWREP